MSDGCGAPQQSNADPTAEANGQVVVAGTVNGDDGPVGGAYVRLLDSDGEFTGEVQTSQQGAFRFYAAPGDWTVRVLHRTGNGQATISADGPGLHQLAVAVG